MVNPRKIYVIDTGLINACSRSPRPQWGHLLENFVFMELRRLQEAIEYYKTASGREVDFVVTDRKGRKFLIQVTAEIDKATTRSREIKALEEAMKELAVSKALVVTLSHEEHLKTEAGFIHVLPAWLWTLSLRSFFE